MTVYHVVLACQGHPEESIDLTPQRGLSYWDARQLLIDFGRMFDRTLHGAHSLSYLEILPVGGVQP